MAKKPRDFTEDAGERLVLVRERFCPDMAIGDYARMLGFKYDTYRKWESGEALMPPHQIIPLRERFNITSDWLYYGDAGALQYSVQQKLLGRGERAA